ncbi:hypothetical protein [Hydrogenophaga sp.]|uniref:hypothetical protein n=1 Tax=Hydrogenophaga sp. TaxID=1904254 RepID=UPI003D0EB292
MALAVGAWLAWYYDPTWFNRAGSLVIVSGVLLAVSRFHGWVHAEQMKHLQENFDAIVDTMVWGSVNNSQNLTPEVKQRTESVFREQVQHRLAENYAAAKDELRAWEVLLVVAGTLINGFGDWSITTLKRLLA